MALDSIAAKRKPYGSAPKQTVILNSVLKKILNGQRRKLKLLVSGCQRILILQFPNAKLQGQTRKNKGDSRMLEVPQT